MEIRKAETPEFLTIWGEKKETQPRNHRDVNLKSASKRDKRTLNTDISKIGNGSKEIDD